MNNERENRKRQLEAELAKIAQEEEAEKRAAKEARANFLFQNIDLILALTPEHNKWGSCNDTFTDDENCLRCFALQQKLYGCWDTDYDIRIELSRP